MFQPKSGKNKRSQSTSTQIKVENGKQGSYLSDNREKSAVQLKMSEGVYQFGNNDNASSTKNGSKIQINDTKELEKEADQISAKPSPVIPALNAATVQRKVTRGKKEYPSTYGGIKDKKLKNAADQILRKVRERIVGVVREDKLIQSWGKVAKSDDALDIIMNEELLIREILNSYNRSMDSVRGYERRIGQANALVEPTLRTVPNLAFKANARNPMLVHKSPKVVPHDNKRVSRAQRFGTHASTLGMMMHPKGKEFQASIRRDRKEMMLSSNDNRINGILRQKWKMAKDLRKSAVSVLIDENVMEMPHAEAMGRRKIRHVIKFYLRLPEFLSKNATVSVPQNVSSSIDGLHAEIRIVSEEQWTEEGYETPTGTKYPCLGCFLYFLGERIEIGHYHGALWVTNAALTKQLEAILIKKRKIGKFSQEEIEERSNAIALAISNKPPESRFVHGKTREGSGTDQHDADSSSDVREDDYADLQYEVKVLSEGKGKLRSKSKLVKRTKDTRSSSKRKTRRLGIRQKNRGYSELPEDSDSSSSEEEVMVLKRRGAKSEKSNKRKPGRQTPRAKGSPKLPRAKLLRKTGKRSKSRRANNATSEYSASSSEEYSPSSSSEEDMVIIKRGKKPKRSGKRKI